MKKILLIETDPTVRGIYRRKFEISGFEVDTAPDGPSALRRMSDFRPDLVQLDIVLPGMSGVEVIREIRALPDFKTIPIFVLSSFYRPDLAKDAWDAGATKCVSKMDCTPNLAVDIVEQLLNSEPQAPAPAAAAAPSSSATAMLPRLVPIPMPAALPSLASGTAPFAPAPPPVAEVPVAAAPSAKTEAQFQLGAVEEKIQDGSWAHNSGATSAFRLEIRQEFLKRVPQIQADLRDRVGSLIKSKSTTDQLALLHELNASVSSLTGLAGITGFTRIAHLSGALDTLIKDLHKKPAQMTSSVLRTIAHASDCLNTLFRELSQIPQDVPYSSLILTVDDEPISRRTITVALSKASLRCVAVEDPKMALKLLSENSFDLIFLDAEMPEMNGFELCTELRTLATNKTTPVIFVTSLTNFEIRAQSSLSGGNDLIAKPFLMMELAVKALTYLLRPKSSVADAKVRSTPAR